MRTFIAYLLGALLVAGLVLLVFGMRGARRARSRPGVRALLGPATALSAALVCLSLFGTGFRHFGGREGISDDGNPYLCAAWWNEVPARQGDPGDNIKDAPYCHNKAVEAIAPAVGTALGIGLVVGSGGTVVLSGRTRRHPAALEPVATDL